MGEIAEVMLEAATECCGELIPHEWEALFEEADRVCDARVVFVQTHPLGRSDDDLLDLFSPEPARIGQVEVLLPQDAQSSHEGAARCGDNVIPGLRGRGVGIEFERCGFVRLAALIQAHLVRPLDGNVRQLRKGCCRKHQTLVVSTTDQVSGHDCSHATLDRYRENNTITIPIPRLGSSSLFPLPRLVLIVPHIPCAIPQPPLSSLPHKPRNFNDQNSNPESPTGELHATLVGRRRAGRTTAA